MTPIWRVWMAHPVHGQQTREYESEMIAKMVAHDMISKGWTTELIWPKPTFNFERRMNISGVDFYKFIHAVDNYPHLVPVQEFWGKQR